MSRPILLAIVTAIAFALPAPGGVRALDPAPTEEVAPTPSPATTPEPTPDVTAAPTPAPSESPVSTPSPSPRPSATPPPEGDTEQKPADIAPGSVVLADGTVLPPMPAGMERSVHADMLEAHAGDSHDFELGGDPTFVREPGGRLRTDADAVGPSVLIGDTAVGSVTGLPGGMQREVLGFLPYWMLTDAALAEMNYQLVSTVAYFSVGALSTGNLDKGTSSVPSTGWAGWTSSRMTNVIDRAHAAGGKVVLTVTMMAWNEASYDRMRTLLNSSANTGRLVGQIVDAVRQRGADGVNLDFEMVPTDLRARYTAFVRQLKTALVSAGVGSHLTVSTTGGAASWATGYDVTALTASGAADALFVMGYDFHWSGSSRAGGVAPIDSPYVLDVSGALADYLEQAPASKLIWGVPYYGRGWSTTTNQLNAPTTGDSFAYYYTGHLEEAATYGRLWDSVGKVPWYRYWDATKGSWVQVYYDDAASLGVKYDLVNRYGLAGTGMWTLLMDGERDELWRLLANKFVNDTSPPAGGITLLPQRTTSMAIPVSWHAIDYQSGLDHYTVQVRDRATSTWTTWLSGTRATSAVYLGAAGRTYEFRVRAVDWKGNAQPWITAPGMPSEVRPGTFARVTTNGLNVRSGAGTSYAAIDTLAAGERVYVMQGPVAAGGMAWFQVQYGFAEWPSAEYARIGWVARDGGGEVYLAPAYAPTVTRLAPFVGGYTRSLAAFSPNGDGIRDDVSIDYSLPTSVSSMRVDVVDGSDRLVRRLDLGPRPAGPSRVSWDGRATDGTVAPGGRYLIRISVVDGAGTTHWAPAPTAPPNVVAAWGVDLDLVPPTITSTSPSPGAELVPASVRPAVVFDGPVTSVTPATVFLERAGGERVPSTLTWNAATRTVSVLPSAPLAPDAGYLLRVTGAVTDHAGNPVAARDVTFRTAPGTVYDPARRFTVLPGTHTAYRVATGGDLLDGRTATFTTRSGASTGQRAVLPNLPGRWLYVENGTWAGRWIAESAGVHLPGETERWSVPTTTRLVFASGSHTGYRYDSGGTVIGTLSATLSRASGASVSARAVINGRWHWLVVNGMWSGYWIPESGRAYRAGFVDEMAITGTRVAFAAGTYTAYRYDPSGARLASKTATLGAASGAPIAGWAVINGRPHALVAKGIWAGLWMPIDARVTLSP